MSRVTCKCCWWLIKKKSESLVALQHVYFRNLRAVCKSACQFYIIRILIYDNVRTFIGSQVQVKYFGSPTLFYVTILSHPPVPLNMPEAKIRVFWDVTLCHCVNISQYSEGTAILTCVWSCLRSDKALHSHPRRLESLRLPLWDHQVSHQRHFPACFLACAGSDKCWLVNISK